jgi:energy-coupling factor transport system ATP-binding protein
LGLAVEFVDVSFSYQLLEGSGIVLNGINFRLESGACLGIIGRTGSGKTTLLKLLNGILVPSKGKVVIGDDTDKTPVEHRNRVGVILQRPEKQLFESSVSRDISYVLEHSGNFTPEEIKDRLEKTTNILNLDLNALGQRSPFSLSDLEKRKTAIAGVLVNDPDLVCFDEPGVGMDSSASREFIASLVKLKKLGKTIIIASHDLEPYLPLLDMLLVLADGQISAFGSPEKVFIFMKSHEELSELIPGMVPLIDELRTKGYPIPHGEWGKDAIYKIVCSRQKKVQ